MHFFYEFFEGNRRKNNGNYKQKFGRLLRGIYSCNNEINVSDLESRKVAERPDPTNPNYFDVHKPGMGHCSIHNDSFSFFSSQQNSIHDNKYSKQGQKTGFSNTTTVIF